MRHLHIMPRRESAESHLRRALQSLEWHRYLVSGGDVEVQAPDERRVLTATELLEDVRVRVSHALVELTGGEVVDGEQAKSSSK